MTKSRRLAYLALFISSFLWGLAPPIIKYTLQFVTPIPFLFFRFTLACFIFAIPLIYRLVKIKPTSYDWGQYFFLGFLCTPLNLLLYFWGINKTTAIDASIIAILAPIFVVAGGVFFLKEKITKKEMIGIIIAVAGTVVLTLSPALTASVTFFRNLFGNFLIIGGDIVWAVFTLLSKNDKNKHLDAFVLSAFSFLVGWLTLLPLFLGERLLENSSPLFSLDPKAIPGIIYMAAFSSVVAYTAYIYGLKKIEASEATVFTYLQPLFAIPVSIYFLKENLTAYLVIGAILVTAGVWVCESRRAPEH